MLSMCVFQLVVVWMVTLKHWSESIISNLCSCMSYIVGDGLDCLVTRRIWQLLGWNSICQSYSHLNMLLMSFWSSFESVSFWIFLYNTQSSANRRAVNNCTYSRRSLIKRSNMSGPNTCFQDAWQHYCKLQSLIYKMWRQSMNLGVRWRHRIRLRSWRLVQQRLISNRLT